MNDNKRLWVVALTITSDDGYISTSQHMDTSEQDARDRLAAFKQRCIKDGSSHVPSYSTEVKGKIMRTNPDYTNDPNIGEDSEFEQFIPTGGYYCGTMDSFAFDPDNLPDAVREYEVEVAVVRKNWFTITVTAENSDSAEELAKEEIENGDHDRELESPDDFEIDIDSCCEA